MAGPGYSRSMSPLTLLAETRGWVAIDKPPGQLVVPGRATEGSAAAPTLRQQLEEQLGHPLWVVHRLDRDTSGVLLFAKDAPTHRALSMAFEAGGVEKRYLLLAQGRWEQETTVDVALTEGRKGKMRPVAPGEAGKPARTHFAPRERFPDATWVEARPETGRTHQIRVHARSAGHPLLVDPQYGNKLPLSVGTARLSRTPLHAASLLVPALEGLPAQSVEAPLPLDLQAVLDALRSGAAVIQAAP